MSSIFHPYWLRARIRWNWSLWARSITCSAPHHHQDGEILAVSPATFSDWLNWTDDYTFVRFGVEHARIHLE